MKDARGKNDLPTYQIALWDKTGNSIIEKLAYISDLEAATTAFWYYAKKHKGEEVTLRQGTRVISTSKKATK